MSAAIRRAATVACLMLLSGSAIAKTRAVVIGIDHYVNVRQLKGALADATDIAGALKRAGVEDLDWISEDKATRDTVLKSLDALVERAKRNDLVIITFAGHGAQETWGKSHPPGVKEGDRHAVFLLTGVALPNSMGHVEVSMRSAARERITGSEIAARLAALDAKGARAIFVADTCHGGGLTREPLMKADASISVRTLPAFFFAEGEDPLTDLYPTFNAPIDTDHQLASLTFLAAVDENHAAPEVAIPAGSSTMRGALSYAFARLLEGAAPTATPEIITRGEMIGFIKSTVRSQAQNNQDPDLRPRTDFAQPVIDFQRDLSKAQATPPKPATEAVSSIVRISTVGSDMTALPPTSGESVTLRSVGSKQDADLTYNPSSQAIYSALGDLIASGVGPADFIGVAEREVAHRRLLALSLSRPADLKLIGGDGRYKQGDGIVVDARRPPNQASEPVYYLLFNISGTGLVQFLYPILDKGDPEALGQDRPFNDIVVRPPFGADTIVLVTSPKPLGQLLSAIRGLDDRPAALKAVELVEAALAPGMKIGLQGMFTAAER